MLNLKSTIILLGTVILGISFTSCEKTVEEEKPTEPLPAEYVLNGKYLVDIGGCHDCHTPKIFGPEGMSLDESRILSGHPAEEPLPPLDAKALQPGSWVYFNPHNTATLGPWGLTYSANLTPHETGMKGWEPEVFIKAMRSGKHMGVDQGRPILPPMPWVNLAQATDEDLKAIYYYLQSLPPVDNRVPDNLNPGEVMEKISENEG